MSSLFSFGIQNAYQEIFVQGKRKEDVKLHDCNTQREKAILRALDIVSSGGFVAGGIVGARLGDIPKFSIKQLLKVVTLGGFTGVGFTILAIMMSKHILESVEDSKE
jgi:hypothetical protein